MERSLKNFIQDYFRGKSVKQMRRVILYKEELPEDLFIYLMNIKAHGNLFYYKKKSNSLSIRDTKKAMAVIKELDFPSLITEEFEELLKLATKRAEYQRIIDNIRNYITEKCLDQSCKMGVNPKIIIILLYAGDHVMKKRLKIKEYQIEKAKENLRNCVKCLGIDFNSVDNFYRI
ncbi:MAG: hypothetical protein JXR70_06695 [Spirochaetales bacterium]|nr:hypothetical protein [Spirochaetales bacterium]